MRRRSIWLLVFAVSVSPTAAKSQGTPARSGPGEALWVSAEARDAVTSVVSAHQKLRLQRNDLQEFALELRGTENLLIRLMSGGSAQDVTELRDRVQRMRALLGVVKAKRSEGAKRSELAVAFEDRCQRLFDALDGILDSSSPELRASKAGELMRDLMLASPQHREAANPVPWHTVILDDQLSIPSESE